MQIHVLGHSDSKVESTGDPDWPVRMRTILEGRLQEPIEVTASRLAPYGPRAVSYAARRVAEEAPDVALLSVSAFACTVGLVYVRVGQRFGKRAQALYQSLEGR